MTRLGSFEFNITNLFGSDMEWFENPNGIYRLNRPVWLYTEEVLPLIILGEYFPVNLNNNPLCDD